MDDILKLADKLIMTVYPVMIYPNSPERRKGEFFSVIVSGLNGEETERLKAECPAMLAQIAEEAMQQQRSLNHKVVVPQFKKAFENGNIAASILYAVLEMQKRGLKASINKGLYRAHKNIGYEESKLRAAWGDYKAVAPLWCAWNVLMYCQNVARGDFSPANLTVDDCVFFGKLTKFFYLKCQDINGINIKHSASKVEGFNLLTFYENLSGFNNDVELPELLTNTDMNILAAYHVSKKKTPK